MNAIDITIIVVSFAIVVIAGLWASRGQDKSAKGYFLASGKMPWWLIGAGFVATSVSSEQIVGTVGATYTHGMGIANWEWFAPNKFLMIVIFVPIYLRNRVTTIPDLLSRRYGPLCADIYSWVMLVAYVFILMPPVLYGGSLAFSELTGWNFYAVLWSTVVLVALYTVHGGLKAVMWTDAIQCVMLIGGGLLLFFVAMSQVSGGWTAMVAAAPERFHLYGFPEESLRAGLARQPAFLGVDSGSTDPGPYYLGSGTSFLKPLQVRRDLELALCAARDAEIPLIIGTAGGGLAGNQGQRYCSPGREKLHLWVRIRFWPQRKSKEGTWRLKHDTAVQKAILTSGRTKRSNGTTSCS